MADTKISAATAQTVLEATNELPLADSGASKKITGQALADSIGIVSTSGFPLKYKSGQYYTGLFDNPGTTQAQTQDTVYYTPMWIPKSTAFDRIGAFVGTAAASTVIRLGIYADDGEGMPGSLTLDAGTIDSTGTGAKTLTISQTLHGFYWLCAVLQTNPGAGLYMIACSQQLTLSTNNSGVGWTSTGVSGALPTPASSPSLTATKCPWVYLRAA
jgi:hypothetical protein